MICQIIAGDDGLTLGVTMDWTDIGGHLALDLINTVEMRFDPGRRKDGLVDFVALLDWSQTFHTITANEVSALRHSCDVDPVEAQVELVRTAAARDDFYAMLFERKPAATQRIADLYRGAVAGCELRPSGDAWEWVDSDLTLATPRHRVVRQMVGFLQRDDLDHLDQCEDARCGRVYLDHSPRRNRRWCVSSECGDRNRSRAYYQRQKRSGRVSG